MRAIILGTSCLFLACTSAFSQPPEAQVSFEVASVKPSPQALNTPRKRDGPGTSDPERYTLANTPLKVVVERAYELKDYQVSGPGWLDSEKFDILAKVPPGATNEQLPLMLRSLLAERFNLTFHQESKELAVYELVVARNGPKLKASDLSIPVPDREHVLIAPDKDGIPQVPPGLAMMVGRMTDGIMHWTGRMQPISVIASFLENELARPVVDRTGLTGKYDFTLEYSRDGLRPRPFGPAGTLHAASVDNPNDIGLSLVGAVQGQLGLKLESKKDPIDILVIDHIDRVPTDN